MPVADLFYPTCRHASVYGRSALFAAVTCSCGPTTEDSSA